MKKFIQNGTDAKAPPYPRLVHHGENMNIMTTETKKRLGDDHTSPIDVSVNKKWMG